MKKKLLVLIAMVTVLSMIALAGCGSSSSADPVKVPCENGVMIGQTADSVTSWKGIPFAKPPVGDLRWRAPEAPDPSDEEIECFEYGPSAIQYEWPSEPASSRERSEDCLSLNIWIPEGAQESKEPLPVMVFFHGGAYSWGGTGDPTYDGQDFLKDHQDVILVTCNYRLGIMAWPDFSKIPGGESYTDVNLGIRDQICALEWVQRNIGGFGGDKDNVTIFGESAGGFTTTALTISPAAKGLFKRAISESGIVDLKDRSAAQDFAEVVLEYSECKNMDDLLAISGEDWITIDEETWISDECCGAVADGEILPEWDDIDEAIQDAVDRGIVLVLGTNQDEWNYFREDSTGDTLEDRFDYWYTNDLIPYWDGVYKNNGKGAQKAMDKFYKYEEGLVPEEYADIKDAMIKSAFKTETWRYQHLDFADRYAKAGGDVYMYLWKVPSTKDEMYKSAVHAVELEYVFNHFDNDGYCGEVDKPSAQRIQEAWTNFAKSGDPSIGEAEWPKYDANDRNTMVINLDGWKAESDPSKTARELMQKIYPDRPVSYDGLYEYNLWPEE